MKINKILNNNAVVVKDGNEEKIVMGSGIAYQKRKNDPVDQSLIEKTFIMKIQQKHQLLAEIFSALPEIHIQISEEIISHAEKELGIKINGHIHFVLTDHISFVLNRLAQGVIIKNTMLNNIKVLYPKEFQIAVFAKTLVNEKLGIEIPEYEIGYIALHIHSAKMNAGEMTKTLSITQTIQEMFELNERLLNIKIGSL